MVVKDRDRDRGQGQDIPCENVLGVVIPQVDLCRSTDRNALVLHVYSL